jgi:hypothetical protein
MLTRSSRNSLMTSRADRARREALHIVRKLIKLASSLVSLTKLQYHVASSSSSCWQGGGSRSTLLRYGELWSGTVPADPRVCNLQYVMCACTSACLHACTQVYASAAPWTRTRNVLRSLRGTDPARLMGASNERPDAHAARSSSLIDLQLGKLLDRPFDPFARSC